MNAYRKTRTTDRPRLMNHDFADTNWHSDIKKEKFSFGKLALLTIEAAVILWAVVGFVDVQAETSYRTYTDPMGSVTYGSDGNRYSTYVDQMGSTTYGSDGSRASTYNDPTGSTTFVRGGYVPQQAIQPVYPSYWQ